MVCHPYPTPFSLPPLPPFPSLFPLPTPPPFSIYSLFWFLLTWKIWGFFSHLNMDGNFVFSANNVGSIIVRAFLQSFVLLCGFVFCCCLFYFFPFMWSLGKHEFRILSHFYLNVVLRVNFLYWSLYWWVHATGNKFLYKSFNQNHCALLRLCLSLAFCPPHRRLLDWTK